MKGHDIYRATCDLDTLFDYIKKHHISVYDLQCTSTITFSSTLSYRKILCEHPLIHYEYTIGLMGMLIRFFFSKEKIAALLFSLLLFFCLSKTIFYVEILGESDAHLKMITDQLHSFQPPFFYLNEKGIYQKLAQLNHELNWYAIHQKGSRLEIHYLPRKKIELSDVYPYDLIASKEGIIARFEVAKGNKVVSMNQHVQKGDVLVSHLLMDSAQQEKTTDVMGKVYAYTFQKVEVELPKGKLLEGMGYYLCLLKSRMAIQLDEDEHIVKEIVLQFSEDSDTIRMSTYYVLYEMIAMVGEYNE